MHLATAICQKDGKELGPLSALNITGTYQVGVDPAIMGVGLAIAIPTAVKAPRLELDDIDVFEINDFLIKAFIDYLDALANTFLTFFG
ncbi:hypothetical protein SLEP1_g42358 [Rubroshorea leprosula]|uniref:Thiolase C-terminal domain-containing protein n=1 Tax=Rubroshorea leprosula TaxID=152421 RepID=A0AAV5LA81_9ROSI|nr:hypothetical protein SLEP1_g42358 [Rubroshorea leprosula]